MCTISEDAEKEHALDLEEEGALRESEVRRSFMFVFRASRRSDGRS
jgi:hypothetical protein